MTEPQIQYCVTADGARIAYYAMGEGPPVVAASNVLWSHLGYQISFREYYRSRHGQGLGRGHTIVRYDARGTGLSDRSSHDFSLEARLTDLETVVDHLKLSRFALFGRSQASPTAIAYAHRYPERVSHLVLLNPFAHGDYYAKRADRFVSYRETAQENWKEFTLTLASVGLGFADAEQAQTVASWFREAMTPEAFNAFQDAAFAIDVGDLLPHVRVPTLVLHSGAFNYPIDHAREVASKIPGARLSVRPAASSYFFWSDDETRAVEDFLSVDAEPAAQARDSAGVDISPNVLTPRELEVLRLLAAGRTSGEISDELSLSIRTVGRHVTNIYRKIGARGRADAAAYAVRNRLT